MISLKVLSAAAVLALALPALTPTESFAQSPFHRGPGGPAAGAARPAGAGGPHFNAGGPHLGAGGPQFNAGGPHPGAGGPQFNQGGGHFAGGGGYRRGGGGGGGFIPGAIAGAVIGGAVAASQGPYYNSYGYYNNDGPYYAGTPYYNAPYDDGSTVVEAAPQGDDDAVAYCMQRYRSYDPGSGTFLGNDGLRHPCP
jgi:BA14K-like protein